jgi:hypothetical protein
MTDHQEDEYTTEEVSEEQKSEVARLFHEALLEHMSEDQASAYLADMLDEERLAEIQNARIFERIEQIAGETGKQLLVTSYHPDRAVREASLAKKEQWQPTGKGELSYLASNELEVYFGGAPLEISEALNKIRKLNESTVLAARIVLGLWNSRRYNKQVTREGSVAILLDEILQWQGIQKHSRTAHQGGNKRYTDGYRTEHRRRVLQDLALLAACQVRGSCKMVIRGKSTTIQVDGPYLRYDTVSRPGPDGEEIILGFLVAPGGWISTYEQNQNETLAQIDQQIFTLNPQNDRYALRLALYLTERWREQAKTGNFSEPITMNQLLDASMIEIDLKNLNKLAPSIEKALAVLENMDILGKQVCLEGFHIGVKKNSEQEWETNTCMKIHQSHGQVDPCTEADNKVVPRWSKEWLASKWELLPPLTLIQAYESLQKPRRRRVRKQAPEGRSERSKK